MNLEKLGYCWHLGERKYYILPNGKIIEDLGNWNYRFVPNGSKEEGEIIESLGEHFKQQGDLLKKLFNNEKKEFIKAVLEYKPFTLD